jgi:hypothetical protein
LCKKRVIDTKDPTTLHNISNMSSLPPALDFVKAEEEVCQKWSDENTFKTQNRLSEERGDEV